MDTARTARTARERARDEITAEILDAARARLAASGPADLSLRAVARDVGMVSSAVYRYFPSRDDLLTSLLIAAYDELGAAAEVADDGIEDRADARTRWTTVWRAVRAWALEHPHDYALLFGTPVIGYVAPRDTVTPAARVILRLIDIIGVAHDAGGAAPQAPPTTPAGFGGAVSDAMVSVREIAGEAADLPDELVGRTIMAWSTALGSISFELWGHFVGAVSDHDAWFDGVVARLWHDLDGV